MKLLIFIITLLVLEQLVYAQSFSITITPISQPIQQSEVKIFNIEIDADTNSNYSIFFDLISSYDHDAYSDNFTINPVNPPYTSGTQLVIFLREYAPIGSRSKFMVEATGGSIQIYDSCYLYIEEAPDWINYYKTGSGLRSDKVTVIENDAYNNKWVGTYGFGVEKFDGFGWQHFDLNNQYITSIAIGDSGKVWIGTEGGISLIQDNNITLISPGNWVQSLAIDTLGNLWAVWGDGIHKYDGVTWTGGYGPPLHSPQKIIIDQNNILWSTFFEKGVGKFDGNNWVIYNTSNSNIPSNSLTSIILFDNDIWLGTYKYLVKFDNANFISYESPINDWIETISADPENTLWLGTSMGMVNFDFIEWTIYNTTNSPLSDNLIKYICNDEHYNTFVGTWNGLSVYNKLGTPTFVSSYNENAPNSFILYQNFPNPFNPTTTIQYDIKERSLVELVLYDVLGREVEVLVNREQDAGYYKIHFNASRLASGIYFYRIQAGSPSTSSRHSFVETKKMILMK